ncbi:MAG: hypothetical protein MJE68_30545 [Proteobacteria bacterium]|nr:hypothetical protein [Pseudomonadota bacterium]
MISPKIKKFDKGFPTPLPPNLDHCLPLAFKAPNSSTGHIIDAGRQELHKGDLAGGESVIN